MKVNNPPKAVILLAALASITLLMAVGRIDVNAGMPLLTAIVFYAIGNGVASRAGIVSEPIIAPRNHDEEDEL
jgi:hypothetical protein